MRSLNFILLGALILTGAAASAGRPEVTKVEPSQGFVGEDTKVGGWKPKLGDLEARVAVIEKLLIAPGPLTFYVNATHGDDSNDGLSWLNAKKSISAAVGDIPVVIQGDVTVNVAAGTYGEQVIVWPRIRRGGTSGTIRLIGGSTPGNEVILDGSVEGPLQFGIVALDPFVEVRWMTVTNYTEGLMAVLGGALEVFDCVITGNHRGIQAEHAGTVFVTNTQISSSTGAALDSNLRGWIKLGDGISIVDDSVSARSNSTVSFQGAGCTLANVSMIAADHSTIEGYNSTCGPSGYSCSIDDPSGRCVP
jgi:hypothetical protein